MTESEHRPLAVRDFPGEPPLCVKVREIQDTTPFDCISLRQGNKRDRKQRDAMFAIAVGVRLPNERCFPLDISDPVFIMRWRRKCDDGDLPVVVGHVLRIR